jgi:hypothetical protein
MLANVLGLELGLLFGVISGVAIGLAFGLVCETLSVVSSGTSTFIVSRRLWWRRLSRVVVKEADVDFERECVTRVGKGREEECQKEPRADCVQKGNKSKTFLKLPALSSVVIAQIKSSIVIPSR